MSSIHLEIFDEKRALIFKKLGAFQDIGYLAGGTGLALHLGHRKSFDFDIFIPKPLSKNFTKKILSILGENSIVRLNASDFIFIQTPEGVEFNFVYYWHKLLYPPVKTNYISLASIADIAADKAHTIGRRAAWRDYVDMSVLLEQDLLTLTEIIRAAKQKFQNEFVEIQFLEQLTFFEDIEVKPIEFINKQYSLEETKNILETAVRNYLKTDAP